MVKVQLDEELYETVKGIAAADDRTVAVWLRHIARREALAHKAAQGENADEKAWSP